MRSVRPDGCMVKLHSLDSCASRSLRLVPVESRTARNAKTTPIHRRFQGITLASAGITVSRACPFQGLMPVDKGRGSTMAYCGLDGVAAKRAFILWSLPWFAHLSSDREFPPSTVCRILKHTCGRSLSARSLAKPNFYDHLMADYRGQVVPSDIY